MTALVLPLALLAFTAPATPAPQTTDSSQPTEAIQGPEPAGDSIFLSPSTGNSAPVCLKLRVYLFERNDGEAPKLVGEKTCTTTRPELKRSKMPKARLIPAM